jgi:hypothetical protein
MINPNRTNMDQSGHFALMYITRNSIDGTSEHRLRVPEGRTLPRPEEHGDPDKRSGEIEELRRRISELEEALTRKG